MRAAIDAVRPGLAPVCNLLQTHQHVYYVKRDNGSGSDRRIDCRHHTLRGVRLRGDGPEIDAIDPATIGPIQGRDIWLLEDGSLVQVAYDGTGSRAGVTIIQWPEGHAGDPPGHWTTQIWTTTLEPISTEAVVRAAEVRELLEVLAAIQAQPAHGRCEDAERQRKRAAQLDALVVLLEP